MLAWPLAEESFSLKNPRPRPARKETTRRLVPGRAHYLLQFREALTPGLIEALKSRGMRVTSFLSSRGVAVSAGEPPDFDSLGVTEARPLSPAEKISPLAEAESAAAYVVEFHADVTREEARQIADRGGLLILEHPDLLPHQLLVAGPWGAVASVADWDEVAYIFPASPDLVAGAPVVACAGAMTEFGMVAQYVMVGKGWGAGDLNYFFNNTTAGLDRSLVETEMLRAFGEWTRYAPLSFAPAAAANAPRTIAILFARGAHGDGYPFDGPGRVLAHTFYPAPPNPEPLAGDMHLDEDETWRAGAHTDLYSVALHEAGHALGLGHSDRPGSVMYPYYRLSTGLTEDDIAGIRKLYGSRDAAQPAQPVVPALKLVVVSPPAAAVTTTAGSIGLSGRVENATGVVTVSWHNDRGGSGSAAGGAQWSIASVPLSAGANAITVTANDGAGRQAASTITATRQTDAPGAGAPPAGSAPPSLLITSPAATVVSTSLAAITLRGTASASTAVVNWSNSAGGSGTCAGTTEWVAADIPLRVGNNAITVRAFDAAGRSSWRSVTVVRR